MWARAGVGILQKPNEGLEGRGDFGAVSDLRLVGHPVQHGHERLADQARRLAGVRS
jgi:hypothetical protein